MKQNLFLGKRKDGDAVDRLERRKQNDVRSGENWEKESLKTKPKKNWRKEATHLTEQGTIMAKRGQGILS